LDLVYSRWAILLKGRLIENTGQKQKLFSIRQPKKLVGAVQNFHETKIKKPYLSSIAKKLVYVIQNFCEKPLSSVMQKVCVVIFQEAREANIFYSVSLRSFALYLASRPNKKQRNC
jgi:hypothetical protein